jgi:subtilisin family serine protease
MTHSRAESRPLVLTAIKRLLILTAISPCATWAADAVLVRGGLEIPLRPSAKYAAVQLKPGVVDTDVRLTSAFPTKNAGSVSDLPILKAHRLILVRTNAKLKDASSSGPSFTSVPDTIGSAVPVYTLGSVDVVLTNEVLFKPKAAFKESVIKSLSAVGETTKANERDLYLFTASKNPMDALSISNSLSRNKDQIEFSEPNFIVISAAPPKVIATPPHLTGLAPTPPAPGDPTDPYFRQQWWLKNTGSGGTKAGADIHAVSAWAASDGSNITIAILDVGVDENHPDLKQKFVHPYDAILKTSNQQPNSWDGHGTACAGIAAAVTNNGLGVSSIARNSKLMPIKVATSPGENQEWITDYRAVARGIEWAVDNGADVISSSWGGGLPDPAVEDAIKNGLKVGRGGRGVIFIFAAGNTGEEAVWPAILAKSLPVISVGATNEWDELKTVSSQDHENWWASNIGSGVTLYAPGVHLFTTDISGPSGYLPGDYFGGFNGTSAAAPIVAGVAALILSKTPTLTADDVKARLHDTSDMIAPGARLNACRALQAANC